MTDFQTIIDQYFVCEQQLSELNKQITPRLPEIITIIRRCKFICNQSDQNYQITDHQIVSWSFIPQSFPTENLGPSFKINDSSKLEIFAKLTTNNYRNPIYVNIPVRYLQLDNNEIERLELESNQILQQKKDQERAQYLKEEAQKELDLFHKLKLKYEPRSCNEMINGKI